MKDATDLGMNRTGIAMAPILTPAMTAAGGPAPQSLDVPLLRTERLVFLKSADPVGSVPIPRTIKGVGQTVLQKLQGRKPEVFFDLLGQRAAYERSGVRLYDLMITKCETGSEEAGLVPVDRLRAIRDEEAAHFQLVAETIKGLGGDPTAITPSADAISVATMGVIKALSDPRTSIMQGLEMLRMVELQDNDSWSELIALANEFGLQEIAQRFETALVAEQRHLQEIRSLHSEAIMRKARVLH